MEVQQLKVDQTNLQRLIDIARPIDLPPLQTTTSPGNAKPKIALPLFGKRNTLKLSTMTSVKDSINNVSSDPLEVEEHDEPEVDEQKPNAEKRTKPVTDHSPSADVHCHKLITEKEVGNIEQISTDDRLQKSHENAGNEAEIEASANAKLSNAAKKRRNRIRLRGERGRENVDFDDSEDVIDTEKYSTWLPPENQSGDGTNHLNDKYGY